MDEEVMPYRKKAKKNTPRKYDHKHQYEPCVIEYMGERLDRGRGFVPVKEARIKEYCTICGKIQAPERDEWWVDSRVGRLLQIEPTERQKRELDPATRTLPTFWLNDGYWQKHVDLKKGDQR